MYVRRFGVLLIAAFWLSASTGVLGQGTTGQARSPQEEQDAQALLRLVDEALTSELGLAAPAADAAPAATAPAATPLVFGAADRSEGDIAVSWESGHFIKGQSGNTYLPFTLKLDDSKLTGGAAFYVRVVNAEQAAAFGSAMAALMTTPQDGAAPATMARPPVGWESLHFIDAPKGGMLQRALELGPGRYVAFIAVKEKTPAPARNNNRGRNNQAAAPAAEAAAPVTGLLRHELVVPDFGSNELQTSSVIVAQTIEPLQAPLPANQQESNPYVFGPMRITPSADGRFSKSGELSVIFWVYGAQPAATGKPDVTISFSFHQRLPEGERYFNRTAPQELNAESLPPEFSIEAGHQLPGSLVVPLASFPAGDYRLEIKVTDKPSGKEFVQNAAFTVLPI